MNTYLWIHRAKGPAMLVIFGVTALLNEWDILSFGRSWPLYLIALGLFQLAERAAWSQAAASADPAAPYAGTPYPGTPYAGAPYPGAPYPGAPYPGAPYPGAPGYPPYAPVGQQPQPQPTSGTGSLSLTPAVPPYDKPNGDRDRS